MSVLGSWRSAVLVVVAAASGWGCSASDDMDAAGGGSDPTGSGGYGGYADAGGGGGSGAWGGTGGSGATSGTGGGGNTNVNLGGSQDFGYFRRLLDAGQVPRPGDFDAAGFFAEHHTPLPPPACGERVCLQPLLGVLGNLLDGVNCTMLQLGLNSPIEATPGERPPLTLAVVVDVSGSMQSAGKIDFVRSGLDLLIDGLNDGDRFALITYSDNANVPFPMADITGNRARAKDIANALVAGGATNLFGGLERGYQEVGAHYESGRQNRVILLSDGQPTAGITNGASIIEMSRGYNSDGTGLTTIGLGTDFNIDLMRDLALQADGNFYFLENSGAVSEVFTEELSYFTVPIGYDLVLDVHAGTEYSFGRALGSPLWQDTSYGGRLEVPSVFLAHRESASDVTPDGGRRGGGSALLLELMPKLSADDGSGMTAADVAIVDVSFREPGTNRIVEDTVVVGYPLPPWEVDPLGYFSQPDGDETIVQKSFVMLNIFVGIERACTEFHSPTRTAESITEAIAALDRLIAAVVDYNTEIQDVDMKFDIELLNQLRQVILQNNVSAPTDPGVPEDPWPCD